MTSFALLQTGLIVWDRDEHRANPWLAAGWLFAAALVTAGGVSSGLELGLYVLKQLYGLAVAQEVADKIEYQVDITNL